MRPAANVWVRRSRGIQVTVSSVAFSPDGTTLATGSSDHAVILWDVVTHKPLAKTLTGHIGKLLLLTLVPMARS